MLFFSFFKKIPDMLILVIYLPPAMLFLISQKIPDMLILVLYLPLTMPLWVVSKSLDTIFPHIVSAETTFFLHLEIQRSQYISPKVTVHKGAETIQGRKLFKGRNYMRKYGILKCGQTTYHIPLNQYWTVLATVVFLSPVLYSCKSPTKFESGTILSLDKIWRKFILKGYWQHNR